MRAPPYRVLIVEDDASDREALRRALTSGNPSFEVVEVDTGAKGLARCARERWDCVLLDHRLPDMDARDFLAVLGRGTPDVPVAVVVITGRDDQEVAVGALEAGAQDHLVKGDPDTDVRGAVIAAIERHASASRPRYNVLIIDDSPEDREIYKRSLGRGPERFTFAEADSGESGIAMAARFRPDCVLLDFGLPDMDGLEVLAALTHGQEAPPFAVIMLTGQGNEALAVKALKSGAEDYLPKETGLDALAQAVRAAVEKVRLRARIEDQRREVERHRNLLQVTLDSIGDAVISADLDGRITFLNPVAEQLTGWTSDQAAGRCLEEVYVVVEPDSRHPVESSVRGALRDQAATRDDAVLVGRDGQERSIDESAAPIRDDTGAVVGAVLVFRDVSERRQLQQELQRRVAELAVADRRKDEFLAMLAHELRNPLVPIKNSLHLLQLDRGNWGTVDRVSGMMNRQVNHLVRMIDDLLDVARITQGKIILQRAPVDLARLVRDIVNDHTPRFHAAGVGLRAEAHDAPIVVEGDATRLTQVVDNFLTNALKFTNEGGAVDVGVRAEGGQAILTVRDTGIGLAPEILPHIFDVFAQADRSLDRSRGGLGLGLAVVKGLVELHGGTVRAESAGLGHGTAMIVTLPLVQQAVTEAAPSEPRVGAAAGRRVLVVEDSRDSAESLRLLLEASGYEVALAGSGDEGVRVASAWLPDIVLCDIGLPGMDGFAVARALRADPRTRSLRLVALSGYGRAEDVRRALDAGFDDHLVKPAEPDRLLAKMQVAARSTQGI